MSKYNEIIEYYNAAQTLLKEAQKKEIDRKKRDVIYECIDYLSKEITSLKDREKEECDPTFTAYSDYINIDNFKKIIFKEVDNELAKIEKFEKEKALEIDDHIDLNLNEKTANKDTKTKSFLKRSKSSLEESFIKEQYKIKLKKETKKNNINAFKNQTIESELTQIIDSKKLKTAVINYNHKPLKRNLLKIKDFIKRL